MNNSKEYIWNVFVRCMTYNHALYITDALNGFCFQKTNFPYVCGIVDDASTDGEQDVIKQYLEDNFNLEDRSVVRIEETDNYFLTFAQHRINNNCYFAVFFLKYNHYQMKKPKVPYLKEWVDNSQFIAMCEGDDYWIDAKKLQLQVDFLNNNPDYSMCFHNAILKFEKVEEGNFMRVKVEDRDYSGTELFNQWTVPTASMLFNKKYLSIHTIGNNRILYGDIIIILKCVMVGRVRGFSKEMSVYRINSFSLIHHPIQLRRSIYLRPQHYEYIKDNFASIIDKKVINNKLSNAYFHLFGVEVFHSLKAIKYLFISLYYDPTVPFITLFQRFINKK